MGVTGRDPRDGFTADEMNAMMDEARRRRLEREALEAERDEAREQLRGAVGALKIAVGCEHPDTCGGPTGQPICAPCIAFARAHVWGSSGG